MTQTDIFPAVTMKNSGVPTKVRLSEIKETGDSYIYSNESGELNESLKDLIGKHPFQAKVHLKPMGNLYEITSELKTKISTLCSRCGRQAEVPIDSFSSELLLVGEPPEGSHSNSDEGPFCNYLPSDNFSLAEFVHEQIAANSPFFPECGLPDCDKVLAAHQGPPAPAKENSPFSILKELI